MILIYVFLKFYRTFLDFGQMSVHSVDPDWIPNYAASDLVLRCRMAGITESAMVAYTHKYAEV